MLKIAKEMHFSETSFILSDKQPNDGYNVRIFTPDIEVPFAGHPTLGTAHIINEVFEGGKAKKIILNLGAGPIPVETSAGGIMTMSQNQPEFGMLVDNPKATADALSINADDIRTDFPSQWGFYGTRKLYRTSKKHRRHRKMQCQPPYAPKVHR